MTAGTRRLCVLFTLISAAAYGCGADSRQADSTVDNLGIQVSAEPTVAVTAADDSLGLIDISDATRLSDGSIAIADAFGDAVRVIGRDGRLIRTIGRSGEGPGEFRSPGWIAQCTPDTLFVWDRLRSVMSVFTPEGDLDRSFSLSDQPFLLSCGDGLIAYLARLDASTSTGNDGSLLRSRSMLVNSAGDSVGSLGLLQAGQARTLGLMTVIAVSGAGVVIGTADSSHLSIVNRTDGTVRKLPVPVVRKPATEALFEAAIDRQMDLVARSTRDELIRRMLRAPGAPDLLPAYRGLAVDPHGLGWLTITPYGTGATEILIVDLASGRVQLVKLPHDLDVLEVGGDYLLARYADDTGTRHLVVYSVSR